ncbi:unnamed protein product [Schistocephalus solidus]|uniref:Uncharacterized protein n=1 Tax=Schistocephalus solidus TaxID=70667 RepID=A0A183SRA8_SCHSO|nr:unnamed protein product [Schistocephalus solidus]
MTAKLAKDERQKYWFGIVTPMEQTSNVSDTRKLNRIIRQVSGKPSTLSDSIRDVNGGFSADNSVKDDHRREPFRHFYEQLITPSLASATAFHPSSAYAVSCDPPSEGGVAMATERRLNNKASGEDGIHTEIYKACVGTLVPWLHEVIEQVWRDDLIPNGWGSGILLPVFKKRDKAKCENYRTISLIDVAATVFTIVFLRRFQSVRGSRTRPKQTGFRVGRG